MRYTYFFAPGGNCGSATPETLALAMYNSKLTDSGVVGEMSPLKAYIAQTVLPPLQAGRLCVKP